MCSSCHIPARASLVLSLSMLSLSGASAWVSPLALPGALVARATPRTSNLHGASRFRESRLGGSCHLRCSAEGAHAGRKLRILFADKLDDRALESLRADGHDLAAHPELAGAALVSALGRIRPNLLVVRSTQVPAAAVEAGAASGLELIVRAGAGVDNIDLAAAASVNVKVANCAGANADAVAELALGLILACDRRIVDQSAMLKGGVWAKGHFGDGRCRGLKGRRLGIVGFGRIGRRMGELGLAMGMQVTAWSRSGIPAPPPGVQVSATLDVLAQQSDVVSVHTAPSASGPLLGARFFDQMKQGAIFVNVARGGVADEAALLNAMERRGLLVGADVFDGEPGGSDVVEFDSELARRSSVVATHHVGAATGQAQEAVADVLLQVSRGFN